MSKAEAQASALRAFREQGWLMGKITKLSIGKSREKRINVFLDGKFTLNLLAEVAVNEGLLVGQELSAEQVEALARSDRLQTQNPQQNPTPPPSKIPNSTAH